MPMSAIVVVSYNHPQYLQPCWNTWNIELHHYKKGPMISTVNHIYICWIPFQQGMLRSWRPKGLNESVADGQNLVPHRYLHTKSAQSKATRAVAAPDLRSTGISSFVRISPCKKIKATMNYPCLNLVLFMAFLQDMFSFIIYFAIPISEQLFMLILRPKICMTNMSMFVVPLQTTL